MIDNKKEKYITTSPDPVSLEGTEKIIEQMNNSVCKLYNQSEGTGFFTKIPYNSQLLPVLITNNHIIDQDDINNNKKITIYLNNDKLLKTIKLDNNRLMYTNKILDITIIEIKEENDRLNNKYLELDDGIINYFKSNQKEEPNFLDNIYSNKSIYLINYPEDKRVVVSYGRSPNISGTELHHKCITKEGSSGSPILLINNQKLIGIHYGNSKQFDYNKGTLLIYSIIEFLKIKNNYIMPTYLTSTGNKPKAKANNKTTTQTRKKIIKTNEDKNKINKEIKEEKNKKEVKTNTISAEKKIEREQEKVEYIPYSCIASLESGNDLTINDKGIQK